MSNDVQATNPDRFLMGVERIGVRCFATSDVGAVDPLRVERHLCEAAAAVIRERERGGGDRPVIALEVVDGRMHEPDVLTVLVQGHLQDAGRAVPGATGGEGGGLLVVSLGLFRNITDPIAGNLFPAAPHAVFYPEPEAERTWRGEPGEDLRAALGRMIDAALAYGHQPSPNRG
ncbi:MAG TPA: hypothetical protein VFG47_07370 [Geminicoccaceae bacterium]|nr:hypothetical protein [Geminicoccaceae bacterium]